MRVPISAVNDVKTGFRAERRLRVLLVGINYAPEVAGIAPYTTGLAQHYATRGHDVQVITGVPHYPRWRHQPVSKSEQGGTNLEVKRYWHFVPRRPHAFGRTLYELTWLISASRSLVSSRIDVILGVIPSLSGGILSFLLSKRLRCPYGLIFQDLLGSAASQSGYSGAGSVAGMAKSVEIFLARRATVIAVVADGFRPYLEGNGIRPAQIHRVRNWNRSNLPTEVTAETRTRLGWKNTDFVCLHAGNMGQKQALDTLLEAAHLISDRRVRIVLAGDGNDRARLVESARKLKLQNVSFIGLQPPGSYEAMLRAADVLIVNQRASVAEMSLPSKLTSYFAAGRPVIAAVASTCETAKEVQAAQAGLVIKPCDPAALANAILSIKGSSYEGRRCGANGMAYADRYLARGPALSTYDQLLSRLVGEPNQLS